jgi:large subunit ribosomal protein L14e
VKIDMPAIDVGRICLKLTGREAGKKCIIVDVVDRNFVLVTGPKQVNGMKRRRVNINHIEPTERKVNIKRGETDEEVMKALNEETLTFLREIVKPTL